MELTQQEAIQREFDQAMADALMIGNGFMKITRQESGKVTFERLAPEGVLLVGEEDPS